jgi:copper(I)-binding protein
LRFSTGLAALALLTSAIAPAEPAGTTDAQQTRTTTQQIKAAPQAATTAAPQAPPAAAQPATLIAENAWIRATPRSDLAAAYLTLRNVTGQAVVVTGIESPLAAHAMIHETTQEGGQSRMRPREPLTVAAHSTVKFGPGGLHVMLHDLKQPLTVGQNVPLVVNIAGGAPLQVSAVVRPLGAE